MITMYTKTVCPYCVRAKNFLEMNNIKYETINVEDDRDGRNWLVEQGFRAVPQFFVEGKLLVEGGCNELIKLSKDEIQNRIMKLEEKSIKEKPKDASIESV